MKNKLILLSCVLTLGAFTCSTSAFALSAAEQEKYETLSAKDEGSLSRVQKAQLKELEIKKKAEEEADHSKSKLKGKAAGGMIGKAAKEAETEVHKACTASYKNASGEEKDSLWDQACETYEKKTESKCKADKTRMTKACDMKHLMSKKMHDAIVRGENPEPEKEGHMTTAEMKTRMLAFKMVIKRIAEIRDPKGEKSGHNTDEKAMDYTFKDLAGGEHYSPSEKQQKKGRKALDK